MSRHIYFYTLIKTDLATGAAILGSGPRAWLPAPATPSGDGWQVALHAEGALPRPLAVHLAEVEVDPLVQGETVSVGIRWRSARTERVVPVLEAELALAPLDGEGAHLSMLGSYRPPLARVGEVGDRIVGHHIAEACVRRFVLDVAARLDDHAAARSTSGAAAPPERIV